MSDLNKDQRAHHRVPLVLSAVVAVGNDRFEAVVTDISAGGAGLQYIGRCPAPRLTAQLELQGFGCFHGITVRECGEFRGLSFLQGEAERNCLLGKLITFIERGLAEPESLSSASTSRMSLAQANGTRQFCEVQNISLQGAELITQERPDVGEVVRLGRMYGRVSTHLSVGISVHFLNFVGPATSSQVPYTG